MLEGPGLDRIGNSLGPSTSKGAEEGVCLGTFTSIEGAFPRRNKAPTVVKVINMLHLLRVREHAFAPLDQEIVVILRSARKRPPDSSR